MKFDIADSVRAAIRATEAVVNLQPGETLDAYSSALGNAAQGVLMQYLQDAAVEAGYDPSMEDMGMEDPDFRAYTDGADAEAIVLSAGRSHPYLYLCMRMTYTRDNAGTFTFGAPEPVVPKRTYDPHPDAAKALGEFVGVNIPAAEATTSPAMKARKNLPAAAYAAPFYAAEDGSYKAGGKFIASKSALPFHVNSAKDVGDTKTIDIPRLKNALARFDQTDFTRFGGDADAVKKEARKRLDAAKSVLAEGKAAAKAGEAVLRKLPGSPTGADVDGLVAAFETFERGGIGARADDVFDSIRSLARGAVAKGGPVLATESAEVQRAADAVLLRASELLTGAMPAPIVRLHRLSSMLRAGRLHDVADGRV